MINSSYSKKIRVIYKYKKNERNTEVNKSTSLKELKELIQTEINFSLSKMKLLYNGSNILLNNENYKVYDFFGDVRNITLQIEPMEFSEQTYIAEFEKAFFGSDVDGNKNTGVFGKKNKGNISSNNNPNLSQDKKDTSDNNTQKKYLKDLVPNQVYNPLYEDRPICNHDKMNEGTYLCVKCRLYWCQHCMKYELHQSDLVELAFINTYLNMKRKNYVNELNDHVLSDKFYPHLEKIDFVLNEKIAVLEKQYKEMQAMLTKIKESQMKLLIDLFYQQVDNKQYKTITQDVQYFKNKLREVESTFNKDKLEENLNNNDVLAKFKDIIKQNYSDFREKFNNYFNFFAQYETFNETFLSQLDAKYKQSSSLKDNISNPEELAKNVANDRIIRSEANAANKTPVVMKVKYYNTILMYDHAKQSCNKIQDFKDRFEFKLNYQVYSGNIFLNHFNRLFVVTGTNFNMFFMFDPDRNEVYRLPSLAENHCRGGMIYVERINFILCISGKFNNKCEKFNMTNFRFPEKKLESENNNSKDPKKTNSSTDPTAEKKSFFNTKKKMEQLKDNTLDYMKQTDLGWTEYPALNYQRLYASFFVYNNKYLYCFFGHNANRGSVDIIEKIDLDANINWEIVNFMNTKYLDLRLSSHGCCYANPDEVYIIGGCLDTKFSEKVYKYNFVQNAIYLTEITIPGIADHEYFRFWEESAFKSLSSYGFSFNGDEDYTFGMFDAKDKFHMFNTRNYKYLII